MSCPPWLGVPACTVSLEPCLSHSCGQRFHGIFGGTVGFPWWLNAPHIPVSLAPCSAPPQEGSSGDTRCDTERGPTSRRPVPRWGVWGGVWHQGWQGGGGLSWPPAVFGGSNPQGCRTWCTGTAQRVSRPPRAAWDQAAAGRLGQWALCCVGGALRWDWDTGCSVQGVPCLDGVPQL